MGGFKIFSRRSSSSSSGGHGAPQYRSSSSGAAPHHLRQQPQQEDYLRLQEENRRLRQITNRIATKIGIKLPTNSKKARDCSDEDYTIPPHVIMAQAHRLQKLNELVVALSQAPRVADAYKIVAQYTREIVGAARVSIALLATDDNNTNHTTDDDEQYLEVYGLDGIVGALPMGMKVPLEGTQVGRVVKTQQPVRVMDCANSHYMDCQKLSGMGVEACVDVPLISSGRVLGTLNTGVTDRAVYYPEVEQMLLQISSVLASAIDKERLLEEATAARNQLLADNKQKQQQQQGEAVCPVCHRSQSRLPSEPLGKAKRSVTVG